MVAFFLSNAAPLPTTPSPPPPPPPAPRAQTVDGMLSQITKFLNEFEVSVRYKLSTLAERVGSLERHLEFCETAVNNKEQVPRLDLPADGR